MEEQTKEELTDYSDYLVVEEARTRAEKSKHTRLRTICSNAVTILACFIGACVVVASFCLVFGLPIYAGLKDREREEQREAERTIPITKYCIVQIQSLMQHNKSSACDELDLVYKCYSAYTSTYKNPWDQPKWRAYMVDDDPEFGAACESLCL